MMIMTDIDIERHQGLTLLITTVEIVSWMENHREQKAIPTMISQTSAGISVVSSAY